MMPEPAPTSGEARKEEDWRLQVWEVSCSSCPVAPSLGISLSASGGWRNPLQMNRDGTPWPADRIGVLLLKSVILTLA